MKKTMMPSPDASAYTPLCTPLLAAKGITKRFGASVANDRVDFTIMAGEIHALLGENGAGKSTFVKMLYGILAPDDGAFLWEGKTAYISSPQAARRMGIAMVFQHFSLFPSLTVAENIALSLDDGLSLRGLSQRITGASTRWGLSVDPKCPVGALSVGEQQRVEILRCLLQDPRLLIMDEPTSVLSPQESAGLFDVLRRLSKEGCAVLYISHKLDEIMTLTEKATILRSGRNVGQVIPKDSTAAAMAEMMVGNQITSIHRRNSKNAATESRPVVLRLNRLNRPSDGAFSTPLRDISLTVSAGEIVGIAGISGNGQIELAEALSGEWRCPDDAMISFNGISFNEIGFNGLDTGKSINIGRSGVKARRRLNIETVPEERNGHATVAEMTLKENTFLTHYSRINRNSNWLKEMLTHADLCHDAAWHIITEHDVRIPQNNPEARQLSGGNLQKFIIGRLLAVAPKLAVITQPTWGVDVGAATIIRRNLLALAEQGCGIILISQDLEEIFSLSDRIAVLNNGALSTVPTADMTAEKIGLLMGAAAFHQTKDSKETIDV
jgi:simple sugar transport system ATP-binding protein